MMKDDFIRQNDITYINWNQKEGSWWDSSAIHHWDPNIYPTRINVHMGAQRGNLNGCNFWH
jgi:hypothetical protein